MRSSLYRLFSLIVITAMLAVPAAGKPATAQTSHSTQKAGSAAVFGLVSSDQRPSPGGPAPLDPAGIQRLKEAAGGAQVSIAPQTAAVRFLRLTPEQAERLTAGLGVGKSPAELAAAFLAAYGSIFGLKDAAAELSAPQAQTDAYGGIHLTYNQLYRGVPVFAGLLRIHFDVQGRLTAANGMFIPGIRLNPAAVLGAENAARAALAAAAAPDASASNTRLLVYRSGLAQGVPGADHLVYQVEVSNGRDVRQFVYVDAHTGEIVEQYSAALDLYRKIYDKGYGPTYLVWEEGDPPYAGTDQDVMNVITYTKETYDLVYYMTGGAYESFDGLDAIMHGVANRTWSCPNASWNGIHASFCTGVSSDDTVAHEWGHAYTEYTHGLIYMYQPGALSEAYSDIFGEVVDMLNKSGLDTPGGPRTDGACSAYTTPPPTLHVLAPPSIVGDYAAGGASFGPGLDTSPVTETVVLANDGVGHDGPPADGADPTWSDACTTLINSAEINGHIAMVDRGNCNFTVKVKNAQLAGAVGVIVANHLAGGNTPPGMGGSDPTITIPSLSVGYDTGLILRAELANGITASLRVMGGGSPDDSYRWLSGEGDTGFGGAIRDLWTPPCYGLPGKVSDQQYYCAADDQGGVHYNVGVPTHAYAMLVDGGVYNGHTISAIGMTKATHIYWRTESVYQTPTTDFVDHADALEQSCQDLIGVDLLDLTNGLPSGEVISQSDCDQVTEAIAAVELRTLPTQCNFQPILQPDTPPLCSPATRPAETIYLADFESNPTDWSVENHGTYPEYDPVDWEWEHTLPGGRPGSAFFALDVPAGDCTPGSDDQSGVRYLTSPIINIPSGSSDPYLAFDHYIATEAAYDGGNVWIKVNSGTWTPIAAADIKFNSYNSTLLASNPLANQSGFSGTDGGTLNGSWGQSLVNLFAYAAPGDQVQLRFAFGNDGCAGVDGWYVDEVNVYACQPVEADWSKQLWLNDAGPFTPGLETIKVMQGDTVTIVDQVEITAHDLVTYTLSETWPGGLVLVSAEVDFGSTLTGTGSLEWQVNSGSTGVTYTITKTFSVVGDTGWSGAVAETLDVEGIKTPITKTINFAVILKLFLPVLVKLGAGF